MSASKSFIGAYFPDFGEIGGRADDRATAWSGAIGGGGRMGRTAPQPAAVDVPSPEFSLAGAHPPTLSVSHVGTEERADARGRTPSAAENGGAVSDKHPDWDTSRFYG